MQFIQTCRTEKPAKGRQPLRIGQQNPIRPTRIRHSSKFQKPERPPAQAGALLAEQHRAAQLPADSCGQGYEHGRQNDHGQSAGKNIKETFHFREPTGLLE